MFFVQHRKWQEIPYKEFSLIERGYEDDGALRARCGEYFDAQLAFLLRMLKESAGHPRVHVAQFPLPTTRMLLKSKSGSPNSRLFDRLVREGVIDTHINLPGIANDTARLSTNLFARGMGIIVKRETSGLRRRFITP